MFAKLSVLGLCLAVVSALQIKVDVGVASVGASVSVDLLNTSDQDPTHVDLYLLGSNGHEYPVDKDVLVAVGLDVTIPTVDNRGQDYKLIAVEVDTDVVLGLGVDITIN